MASSCNSGEEFSKIPCNVCGASSSGYHFGAVSCESCKVFFSRSLKRFQPEEGNTALYKHRCNKKPGSPPKNPRNCQQCRFEKCLAVGMSKSAIRVGRHCAERRMLKETMLVKLAESRQLLPTPISRRTAKANSADMKSSEDSANAGSPSDDLLPVSLINESRFLLNKEAIDSENILHQTITAFSLLEEIRWAPNVGPIFPEMPTEAIWGTMMMGHQVYTEIVRKFVRALPGFKAVTSIPDRVRLFNGAYHPLFVTQLSLDYDQKNRRPKFFSVDSQASVIVLERLPLFMEFYKQFVDAGIAITKAGLTKIEMALMCALLFFNPDPHPHADRGRGDSDIDTPIITHRNGVMLSVASSSSPSSSHNSSDSYQPGFNQPSRLRDVHTVDGLSATFWRVAERFIRGNYPPHVVPQRLAMFSQLLQYFRNSAALAHHNAMVMLEFFPEMANQSRLFAELLSLLLADNFKPIFNLNNVSSHRMAIGHSS